MPRVLTLLPDGIRLPLRDGETVLAACSRYGFGFTVGCRRGGCGVCRLELVSGRVAYPTTVAQAVLADADREGGVCLACRAVPVTDVVVCLRPSDRLKRSPFSDMLVRRELEKTRRVEAPPQQRRGDPPGMEGLGDQAVKQNEWSES